MPPVEGTEVCPVAGHEHVAAGVHGGRQDGSVLQGQTLLECPGDVGGGGLGLERSLGGTGLLALKPVLRQSARDLWQVYFLEEAGRGGGRS
jgi:hypothetical protein